MTRLRISGADYAAMQRHLFRADSDEHGAIVLAGVHEHHGETVLLGRELHLLPDHEFPPGEHGYRQFCAAVLARLGNRAAEEGLALVTCHSHPKSTTRAVLSPDDENGHRRVFPHLLDIVDGQPVAGIAFGTHAAAGEVWFAGGEIHTLDAVEIVGHQLLELAPRPRRDDVGVEARFERQARMFGAGGQQVLRGMTVGVVGLGGGGSMIVEQLAHLGVGGIVAVDFDVVKPHNLSRIVGASEQDATQRQKKIAVAARLVASIDESIDFQAVDGDIADSATAVCLLDCDFLFLATDTITSRLVANAIVHSHLIPMIQIGAKVDLRAEGTIESVYVAVRPVFPRHGCLQCAGLIPPAALQREAASAQERAAQNYLDLPEIIDPSVITLNGIGASTATNLMLMSATGLAAPGLLAHRVHDVRHGSWVTLQTKSNPDCPWCGDGRRSRYARGDAAELPVRIGSPPAA